MDASATAAALPTAVLGIYEMCGEERRAYLIDLARPVKRQKVWWTKYQDSLPAPYYTYIDLEAAAGSIMVFQPTIVDGLLQTEDYAHATVTGGWKEITETEVQSRVDARMLRQQHLTDRRAKQGLPRVWAILDESVLHRPIGGRTVFRAQLEYLLEAMQDTKTTVQIMPFSAGAHPGTIGAFGVLGFEPGDQPAVYVETIAGDAYVEEEAGIQLCSLAFEHLQAKALSPEDTTREIEKVLATL